MSSPVRKIVGKIAFGQARNIVGNAEAVKNYLLNEGISAAKIKVIYNGLDLKRREPKNTERKKCEVLGFARAGKHKVY